MRPAPHGSGPLRRNRDALTLVCVKEVLGLHWCVLASAERVASTARVAHGAAWKTTTCSYKPCVQFKCVRQCMPACAKARRRHMERGTHLPLKSLCSRARARSGLGKGLVPVDRKRLVRVLHDVQQQRAPQDAARVHLPRRAGRGGTSRPGFMRRRSRSSTCPLRAVRGAFPRGLTSGGSWLSIWAQMRASSRRAMGGFMMSHRLTSMRARVIPSAISCSFTTDLRGGANRAWWAHTALPAWPAGTRLLSGAC